MAKKKELELAQNVSKLQKKHNFDLN